MGEPNQPPTADPDTQTLSSASRRETIKRGMYVAGGAVTASALTWMQPRHLHGKVRGANERVVLGLIGCGGRGRSLATRFAQRKDAVVGYLCDVDESRVHSRGRTIAGIQRKEPQPESDLRRLLERKDLDAVIAAVPDHWHALATVLACQAGKDVYVEKPASYSIWEGQQMVAAARKFDRVVQTGLQNRSAPYVQAARAYIQSGKLGGIHLVKVYNLKAGGQFHAVPDSDPPKGLNYDMWLGPAPKRRFNARRFHGGWHYFWEYCGGDMGNDGSHQLDLARMLLGDPGHPTGVSCSGGRFAYDDNREVPDTQICAYDYPKMTMTFELTGYPRYMAKTPNAVRMSDQFPQWALNATRIEFYGSKEQLVIGRHGGGWQVFSSGGKVVAEKPGLHPDPHHQTNFIECIKSRKRPNADIEHGHNSAVLSHLGNIAYRVGNRKLAFDGAAERFTGPADGAADAANKLVKRAPRSTYAFPKLG